MVKLATLINFIVLHFKFIYTLPSQPDLFVITQFLFALIVTALTIVASFAVSSQWREAEMYARSFSDQIDKAVNEANQKIQENRQNILGLTTEAHEKIQDNHDAIDQMTQEITLLKTTISTLQNVTDTLGINLDKVDERVKDLVAEQANLISGINKRIGELSSQITIFSETFDTTAKEVNDKIKSAEKQLPN